MTIFIKGHDFRVELERVCRLFYPDERIRFVEENESHDPLHARIILDTGCEPERVYASLSMPMAEGSREYHAQRVMQPDMEETDRNLVLADALFAVLTEGTGYTPPWGMLTGVRPVKLLHMLQDTIGAEAAEERLVKVYHCTPEKYRLCAQTMRYEQPILDASDEKSFSLYISIPFCPTRCSYCSFVSQSIEKAGKLMTDYVPLLIREIEATADVAKQLGLRLETVYMGGGTPTTLSAQQMSDVLGAVNRCFDMSCVREFTVEAGRPDTVTTDKLMAIKNAGVHRISINPQTLSDRILENIGRRHTSAQVYEAMELARKCGFDDINMDLIAGLPGDDQETFSATLEGVLSLDPENITVHTLSMKRASNLVTAQGAESDAVGNIAGRMLELCDHRLPAMGYHPYYLYRQTRMVGNLENVGWAKDGHDGLYNVYIMDETHTILAVGAGGVTKLRQPGVNNIQRVYNFKFPYEYNSRFDTLLERKKEVISFYEEFC